MSVWSRGMIPASGVSKVQEVPGSNPGTDRFCFLFFFIYLHASFFIHNKNNTIE